ncbi:MAG: ABC transporter substrate-binding protein [Candidatus Cloacimonadales bacterium]|jgi:polar amino acid transport system substrate-binding protein|nr:ABC transporter substrate-binding protein [Candidatus Cloacimonadota bacterium]MDD2650022.1 ABC transporter substrate-binding protein [Candidatus Cloacimonadota bacterium]MDD3501027.1 ABC transporter substrate-binding protein [Candidatus Cloacimonadota bacterium]MDX9978322.1 ABC transporter substrate-binding protein [Candidatus Cloacimonadales bacterium]
MKNKIVLISLLFVFVLIVTVIKKCGNDKKELLVGISSDFYPFNFKDSLAVNTGIEIDMINSFCKNYNIKPVYVQSSVKALLDSLNNKKLDMVISSLNATEDRKQIFTCSNSYYNGNQVVVANKDLEINELADISKYKVGVLLGSSGEYKVDKELIEAKLIRANKVYRKKTLTSLLNFLEDDEVDVILVDKTIAESKQLDIVAEVNTNEDFCILLPAKSAYTGKVNKFINKYLKSDEYAEGIDNYFFGG